MSFQVSVGHMGRRREFLHDLKRGPRVLRIGVRVRYPGCSAVERDQVGKDVECAEQGSEERNGFGGVSSSLWK